MHTYNLYLEWNDNDLEWNIVLERMMNESRNWWNFTLFIVVGGGYWRGFVCMTLDISIGKVLSQDTRTSFKKEHDFWK